MSEPLQDYIIEAVQARESERRKLEMFDEMAEFIKTIAFFGPAFRAREYEIGSSTVNGLMDTAESIHTRIKELQ